MILLMNKFTNIVMGDWYLDEIHANYLNMNMKILYILHPNVHVMNIFMGDWKVDEKPLSKQQ